MQTATGIIAKSSGQGKKSSSGGAAMRLAQGMMGNKPQQPKTVQPIQPINRTGREPAPRRGQTLGGGGYRP